MPAVKLQRRLLLLAAVAILPLAIMSSIGLFVLAKQQRTQTEHAALEISRALLTGVDAELGRSISVLEAMATSPMIDVKNFSNLHQLARRIAETRPHWQSVILHQPDGTPVIHTSLPYGAKLPPLVEPETFQQALRTAQPVVGQLAKGPNGIHAFAVRVPAVRAGEVRYVLTAVVKPESILSVVQRQRLPNDWVVSVFDAENHRVARSRSHSIYLGQPPAPTLVKLMEQGLEGAGISKTLEGEKIFTAYSKSPYTRWTVAIGIPPEFTSIGSWGSLTAFAIAVLSSIAIAILTGLYIARNIGRHIGDLAVAARALGRGDVPAPPVTNIREIQQVADALSAAATERKRHESERELLLTRAQEARAAAEAANRAKDEFLAMLGHELRNPLGAISNATRLLDHPRVSPEAAREARAIIGRQVDHLTRMTDDLLDAARAIAGKIALHCKPVNLADATTTALAAITLRSHSHQIEQRFEPVWVNADATRLEQIISNLLVNAVKYTPTGGTIFISVHREANDAVLRVADTGIGMPPELTARVFDLFVQGKRALDRSHGGLGIGLTLVRRLTEMHGGSVEAKSAGPQRGSEFIVRLPALTESAAPSEATPATKATVPHDIVLVEDNDDARNSLRQLLEVAGHRVRAFADGAAGLQAILAVPPDVALVDVGLPKLDGYEVARRVRASSLARKPFLIALTGYGLPDDRRRSLDAGFDEHLVKPIDSATLERLLATVPTTRQSEDSS